MGDRAAARPTPNIELFRDIFNASPIGIAIENFDGRPLFVNPALCSFLGFGEDELLDKHCVQFSPPEDAEKDWALFQKLRAGSIDHYQLEKRYFRRDGSLVWGSLSISLLNDRPSPLILAMVHDITEKKTAEEDRYRHTAIIESSEDAIASGTLDGIIVSWNEGAQRMYGYTESEAVGKSIAMLVPSELPDEENRILETLRAGGRIEHFETVRVTKTGKRINVSLTISPIKDSSGRTVGISGIARDITERKRAEEFLRESEERFRLAAQAGRMYAYTWDVTTDLIARSGNASGVLGSTGEAPQTRQQTLARVHPDDREIFNASVSQHTPGHPDVQISYRMLRPDGSVVWVEKTAHAMFDEQGRMVRVVGMVADVTERKKAEVTLRESEERFRLAALAGRMFAYEWDAATDVLARSEDFAKVLVTSEPAETTGQKLLAKVHPDDRERVATAVATLNPESPDLRITYRMVCGDGTTIWVERTSHAEFDQHSRIVRIVGMVKDVTEQKQAEEALQQMNRALEENTALLETHEELLRVFVKNVPAAVAMLDRDMRYLQVSDRWCSDNSVEASEILGRSRYEVGPEMPERWKEVNRRALEGETLRAEEDRWESGGKTRWCRWVVRPWKTVDGTVGGVLVLTEDITRRKEMEEALSEMSRKLIESQEQERARIARELHDDIGQRLAMLTIDLDEVKQIWPDLPPEVLSRMLELRQQAKQISAGVQSLSHDLHSSQLEHLGAVTGIKSWCREFGERQRIQIDFEHDVQGNFSPEIGLCLFRVLQEALHNAAKHSGVKRVKIALTEDSGEIHLLIRDFGKGFDLEAAKHGRGLGLTSMQERVRLVNGMIEIQSKPMEGTAIHVRVPFQLDPNSQRAAG